MKIHHTKPRKRYAADCSEALFGAAVVVVLCFVGIAAIAWSVLRIVGVI